MTFFLTRSILSTKCSPACWMSVSPFWPKSDWPIFSSCPVDAQTERISHTLTKLLKGMWISSSFTAVRCAHWSVSNWMTPVTSALTGKRATCLSMKPSRPPGCHWYVSLYEKATVHKVSLLAFPRTCLYENNPRLLLQPDNRFPKKDLRLMACLYAQNVTCRWFCGPSVRALTRGNNFTAVPISPNVGKLDLFLAPGNDELVFKKKTAPVWGLFWWARQDSNLQPMA